MTLVDSHINYLIRHALKDQKAKENKKSANSLAKQMCQLFTHPKMCINKNSSKYLSISEVIKMCKYDKSIVVRYKDCLVTFHGKYLDHNDDPSLYEYSHVYEEGGKFIGGWKEFLRE